MACEMSQRTALLLLAEYSSGKVNSAEIELVVMEFDRLIPTQRKAQNKGFCKVRVTHPVEGTDG
jgi:hypothetical protein